MIDRDHTLPLKRQAQLLAISRGTVYYQPKPISPRDQLLMKRIDRLHLELPFAGARMLRDLLRQEGHKLGRSTVARLMRLMGIEALYRKPKTTQRHPGHTVYPYLLRHLAVTRPNQVWAMAGKKRLSAATVREANTDEVVDLKRENKELKQAVAELYLRNDWLKKSLTGQGVILDD